VRSTRRTKFGMGGNRAGMGLRDKDATIHTLFDIGVIAKGLDGVLEILGGVLLFFLSGDQINSMIRLLTQHELSEDPHDLVASFLLSSAQNFSIDTKVFAAFFLLWHGLVKTGLVAALLAKQWWAYPLAIGAFGLFLIYQLYRYTHTHSVWLLALSILDVFVIVITWLEYRRLRAAHGLQ
jgi:uncharacterized membrane protein